MDLRQCNKTTMPQSEVQVLGREAQLLEIASAITLFSILEWCLWDLYRLFTSFRNRNDKIKNNMKISQSLLHIIQCLLWNVVVWVVLWYWGIGLGLHGKQKQVLYYTLHEMVLCLHIQSAVILPCTFIYNTWFREMLCNGGCIGLLMTRGKVCTLCIEAIAAQIYGWLSVQLGMESWPHYIPNFSFHVIEFRWHFCFIT